MQLKMEAEQRNAGVNGQWVNDQGEKRNTSVNGYGERKKARTSHDATRTCGGWR